MKKTTLLILMLFISALSFSQVLNDAANWPNVAWSVSGTYSGVAALFESDPTTTTNFAYDDNAGGYASNNSIAAESPYLNLNGAFAAGETFIYVDVTYIYNHQNTETLSLEYWDQAAGAWVHWVTLDDTGSAVTNNYCADTGTAVDFTTPELDISGFTTTQLSAFRYRILYDDNNIWARGFCVSSPTIYSGAPPTCPAVSDITIDINTDSTVTLSWLAGGTETQWEVAVVPTGAGAPTGAGTTAGTNNSFVYTTGLTANTTYDIYVRADCGAGDYSVWVGPITFTTYDVPPTAPTGVTCTTGSASFIFTEDFDAVGGWTGDINSGGASWEIPDGSTSVGTGPAAAYSGTSFMNFEASGAASGTSGSIVSPEIDLTTATGAVELSFYLHAFGPVMGTLEVGIGTSATGPFTNEFTWVGDYQASATQPWIPVGIDLSSYAGQNIYVEFKQTSAGNLGDMSIDFMRVQACGTYCVAPSSITATGITDVQAVLDWIANNGETSWEVVVQPAGTGGPTGAGTTVTALPVTINNLLPDTTYEVYVRGECTPGFYSDWSTPYTFTTEIQTEFTVDCAVGPTNVTYCYGNNDNTTFTFTSSDPTIYLTAVFNSGTVENGDDEITIYDSDGTTVLYSGYGNAGDLAGLEIQSTAGVIYIQITSDGSSSCATGEQSTLDFTVLCTTCINPTATYSTVSACDVQNQVFEFYVDVEITDMGDATSLNIDDDMGSATQVASAIGTYTFGPYTNTVPVTFTVANANDPNCVITSTGITQDECPPITDSLCQTVDAGDDYTADCSATVSGVDLDADFFISGTSTTAYQLGEAQCIANVQTGTAVGINTDDVYSDLINIGFNFCYFGNTYNQLVVGANGVVSFNAAYANAGCPWAFTESIPDPGLPLNTIFGVYHDIHPGVCGDITYELAGTAPDRTFKINFESVCHFSCTSIQSTSQIVLYESSNVVEINIIDKPTCTTWNGGRAAAGIQNADGTIGYFPPNRNTGVWTATNESWRFYPAGPANYTFQWLDDQGNVVGTDPQTTVYPQGTTTYTAEVTYNQCDGTTASISDDVVVTMNDFVNIGAADPLEVCDEVPNDGFAEFDLTSQDAVIMNGLTGGVVTYYASYTDAENSQNPLSSPFTNTDMGGQTIYARLDLSSTGCYGISDFEIVVNPAPEVSFSSASVDKPFCEDYTLEASIDNVADLSGSFEFAWYDDGVLISGATASTYILAADGSEEGIFTVTVTDLVSGCSTSEDVEVVIVGNVIAGQPSDFPLCDDISNDGYAEFDLTSRDDAVIAGQANTVVSYYASQDDADDGINALSSPYTNEDPDVQTIYVRLQSTVSDCYDTVTFDLLVYNTPILDYANYYEVCSNGITATTITTMPSGFALTDPGVTFTWTQDGGAANHPDSLAANVLNVYDAGVYGVEVTTEHCDNYFEIVVNESEDCFIPQGISPGNDSKNESFDLDGFDIAHISIFNRLGKEVYSKSDYTDEWHGQTDAGEELPVGTYFYVLTQGDGTNITGWVYVNREN